MKGFLAGLLIGSSVAVFAQQGNYYLKDSDQPFFKNDSNGRNNLERMDNTVLEINRMWAVINGLKAEIAELRSRLDAKKP